MVVFLITDGLDRDAGGTISLAAEMARLHLWARRLIFLNPLPRRDAFRPKAAGIRAMLPQLDSYRSGHFIASPAALAEALSDPSDSVGKARLTAKLSGRSPDGWPACQITSSAGETSA